MGDTKYFVLGRSVDDCTYEYFENPDLLDKDMREMVQVEAVLQRPTSNFGMQQLDASQGIFQMLFRNQQTFPELQIKVEQGKVWKIHKQKFSDELFDNLVAWGLAIRVTNNDWWYWVEESVAACMMTTLAALIGEETSSIPSTDDLKYLPEGELFLPAETDTQQFRTRLLDEVMPYPEQYKVGDLVDFKHKHLGELKDFRQLIERNVLQLRTIGDPALQEEMLNAQVKEILDRRAELEDRLKQNKLGKFARGGVKGAVVDGVIALITGDVFSPTATILKGIYDARKQFRKNPIKDEDLAYIALLAHKSK